MKEILISLVIKIKKLDRDIIEENYEIPLTRKPFNFSTYQLFILLSELIRLTNSKEFVYEIVNTEKRISLNFLEKLLIRNVVYEE